MNTEKIKNYKDFYNDFLLNNVVKFWEDSDLIDKEYGGFITSVDEEGKSYNNDKSVWFQGRCLWTFSKLCNMYGVKDSWEKAAKFGAEFIKKHCIDKDGRMFFTVIREGYRLEKEDTFFRKVF